MSDKSNSDRRKPRPIVERVEVTGNLILQTPAHFGGGDAAPLSSVDMVLLRDPLEDKALLPGASIAGALRSYLREVTAGYGKPEGTEVTSLFGGSRGDDEGEQSPLIVDDALAVIESVELRDGVGIDPATRTAADGKKFDMEVLAAGTSFPLHFELLISEGQTDTLLSALAQALRGFEQCEIPLGTRKRRGLGQCKVEGWAVTRYDLTEPRGLVGWLRNQPVDQPSSSSICEALGVTLNPDQDKRHHFSIEASFALDGSLLVRSGFGEADSGPDVVHLHSIQADGTTKPIVPGTSLAGVLRHRALRIANTLRPNEGDTLVCQMFGNDQKGSLTTSRVMVQETVVAGVHSLVQNRIKIDRFTGGAYSTALFNEEPIWGGDESRLTVHLTLRNPVEHEVGLLLLLLKDLWSGDLPLGGESSIGRGRLKGIEATLALQEKGQQTVWKIARDGNRLKVDQPDVLQEKYVDALNNQPWEVKP